MTLLRAALIVALAVSAPVLAPQTADAKQIERACLQSDRRAANRRTCQCIQRVADQVLTNSDQRKAAGFFRDPDKAQQVRMSDRRSDERFWDKYRAFGDSARAICG